MTLAAAGLCTGPSLFAADNEIQHSSEFLVFLSGDYSEVFDEQNMLVDSSDFTPALDILYSKSLGRWRILGEYVLTDDESELERLHLGYDASDESTFWLGRFHQPTSAWVAKYHHGRFLQTSISRPAIEEWEDDGGVIPTHVSGLMLDHGIPLRDGRGTRVSMAFGAGPYLENGELAPFDFFNPNSGQHRLGAGVSVAFFPDYLGGSNFGFSIAHSQIEVLPNAALGIQQTFYIDQSTVSVQADWRRSEWQLLSAVYYVNSSADDSFGRFSGWFLSGYNELQRASSDVGTFYGRFEFSDNARSNGYLSLFPDFSTGKAVFGYRHEIRENQAVSIELSDESWLSGSFKQARIQWSSVLP